MIKKSKSKWIASGVIAFTSLSLIATGFASWVIGTSVTNTNFNGDVTIDTVDDDSIKLEVTPTENKLSISENVAANPEKDYLIHSTGNDTDLDITVTIKITMGEDYLNDHDLSNVTFSLAKASETNLNGSLTASSENNQTGFHTGSSLTYIELDTNTTTVNFTTEGSNPFTKGSATNGLVTYTLTNHKVSFKWGSYFGNESPVTYYNKKLEEEHSKEDGDVFTLKAKIAQEMKALSGINPSETKKPIELEAKLGVTDKEVTE